MNSNIIPLPAAADNESPFDAIRQVRDDGSEYWSARDLMGLMGYARWEDFYKVTRRAEGAARNTNGLEGFSEITEKPESGRPRINYHLSRYACYLVAMNGDPNMAEVAAAQAYFAIRTREAEVRETPKELTFEEMVERTLLESRARIQALELTVQELEPKATAWERMCSSTGDMSASEAAKTLARGGYDVGGLHKLYALCDKKRSEGGLGWFFRNGHEQREPYQSVIDRGLIRVKTSSIENSRTGEMFVSITPRFTAKALDAIAKHLDAAKEINA
ncbi:MULTISPECIES: phage antirepressor KilAC domain-containing protein [Micrococcales]|mgnify:CR=1 FL=1|uniref:phage antirepressor KilAC domain-containing protein n=1 Tax=Micrococcales TaxID=85006 RepID=UPI002595AC07|nr:MULTISPECIES: phage antirepressor KilAC domain-containing protein [Micrococcales]